MKQRHVVPLLLTLLLLILVALNALEYFRNDQRAADISYNIQKIQTLQKDVEDLTMDLEEAGEELALQKDDTEKLQAVYDARQEEIRLMQDTLLLQQLYVEEKQMTVDGYDAAQKIDTILLSLHNAFRENLGLGTLSTENFLVDVATLRSEEAHELWSHTRPDGSFCLDLIPLSRPAAENLSYIKRTELKTDEDYCREVAEKLFQSLLDSPTHYENIVKNEMEHIGIRTYVTREVEENVFRFTTAYIFSN
ncbi:MAG: hypothetical protein K5682_09385 [Lachnospiraceae bacterium]|nr:hypothetical protein [Lachnospiraceae bacterium]